MSERGIRYRFRSAFKQKVILEFESGKLTIAEASQPFMNGSENMARII